MIRHLVVGLIFLLRPVDGAALARPDQPPSAMDSLLAVLQALPDTALTDRAMVYIHLEDLHNQAGQQDAALRYSRLALDAFRALGDAQNTLHQLIRVAVGLRDNGVYGESLERLMEALAISRERKDADAEVEALLAMGFLYAIVERWDDAFARQREALAIYERTDNRTGIARIHNDMGVTHAFAGDLDAALAEHEAALAIRLELTDAYDTFSSYSYIGEIQAMKGAYPAAITAFETALTYRADVAFQSMIVAAHHTLGIVYWRSGDKSRAAAQFEAALRLSRQIRDTTGEALANLYLARAAMAEGAYQTAITRLREAERTSPAANLQFRSELYEEIASVYFSLGDYRNAYLNSLTFAALKDSVLSAQNLEKISRLNTVMAFEHELALKREGNERQMAVKQAEVDRARFNRNLSLAGLLLAVGLVVATFIRYVEKNRLNRRLNDTLEDLRSTQAQLIQQEKLASLGQLTAGIAHEIKNPLNFVNNFAGVSLEMVEEARKDVLRLRSSVFGEDSPLTTENRQQITIVDETLADVGLNLRKIVEHGSRADGIVRSMLMHSRGGTGKMEPTDLNALVKEYANLSYHGMRAGKNPIDADLNFDLDESVGTIPLIAEDFSRVIVNICNNAFDAMKDVGQTDNGKPKTENRLSIRTKRAGGNVTIEIEDNGPGIPADIRDKILQPFFTTKRGTQGTGLGLSITQDIIQAHRGQLSIRSEPGSTVFSIRLDA